MSQNNVNNFALQKKVTLSTLKKLATNGEKFGCISLYDAAMSALAADNGVETLLVGDSLGMTIQGHNDTLPVTMEQMIYHTAAVARGNQQSLLIADLPFMSYASPAQAMENATRLMQAGAHMVKLEGGQWLCETVSLLVERGIPVCAHLGLTPQSVNKLGGFKVQGKSDEQAETLLADCLALEQAGADLVVFECIPRQLAKKMTEALTTMLTIGIGAGSETDAQVLVINDILGITKYAPKFSKDFLAEAGSIAGAMRGFMEEVKAESFPALEHSF